MMGGPTPSKIGGAASVALSPILSDRLEGAFATAAATTSLASVCQPYHRRVDSAAGADAETRRSSAAETVARRIGQ
jgi:hypothetical protein